MSDQTHGIVLDEDPPDRVDGSELLLRLDKKQRLVVLAVLAPGGSIPLASYKGSGTLIGAAGLVEIYLADVPTGFETDRVNYPRSVGTTQLRFTVSINKNTFTVAATTVTVFDGAGATIAQFVVAAGVVLEQGPQTFAVAFSAGEKYDVQVSNPGNAADVGKEFACSYTLDFLA
jgi:hypothetical protein